VKEELWQNLFDADIFTCVAGWLGNKLFVCPSCTVTVEEIDEAEELLGACSFSVYLYFLVYW